MTFLERIGGALKPVGHVAEHLAGPAVESGFRQPAAALGLTMERVALFVGDVDQEIDRTGQLARLVEQWVG